MYELGGPTFILTKVLKEIYAEYVMKAAKAFQASPIVERFLLSGNTMDQRLLSKLSIQSVVELIKTYSR